MNSNDNTMQKIVKLLLLATLAAAITACHKDKPIEPTPDDSVVNIEVPDTPRYLAAAGGKLYVTCYRQPSVVRIDTASLRVEAVCPLGNYQPEGIAIAGGKLFVASSWIADESGDIVRDDKVYVIDLASFSVTTTLTVGLNPQRVETLDGEHVVVNYLGDYGSNPGGSCIIDAATLSVTQTGHEMTGFCTFDGLIYAYAAPYGSATVSFFSLDPTTLNVTPILSNVTVSNTYGIRVIGGDVYVTSAPYNSNGDLCRYALDGTLQWQCEAGMFPNKVEPVGDGTAYVLNEGSWGSSNASLGRVTLSSGNTTQNVFTPANGRNLGDIAQDVLVYGSKAYVTVSFSNTIEAVNIKDNKSTQIAM